MVMKQDVNYISINKKIELYNQYLHTVSNINLTIREVDVIACLIKNKGDKKIADLLSISYRTVNTHVSNISKKFRCNSRGDIIDLIERSGKLQYIHQYYFNLLMFSLFKIHLKKIGAINHTAVVCSIQDSKSTKNSKMLLQQIIQSLKMANIVIVESQEISKSILPIISVRQPTSTSDLLSTSSNLDNLSSISVLLDKTVDIPVLKDIEYIDFTELAHYYFSVLKLIKKIMNTSKVNGIIQNFQEAYHNLHTSCDPSITVVANPYQKDSADFKIRSLNTIRLFSVIISFVGLIIILDYILHTKNSTKRISYVQSWNLPAYLNHYVERHNIKKSILDKFQYGSTRNNIMIVGIYGLGGIGKTTLANDIIHNPAQSYSFRGWIRANSEESLKNDYFTLCENVAICNKDMTDQQKIFNVKKWLEEQENILLVYDNIEDMNLLEKYLPNTGHILVTSRNYNVSNGVELNTMNLEEATELFNNITPTHIQQTTDYKNNLKSLLQELGFLPLTLSQAAAYISENMMQISEYLSIYNTERDNLLSHQISLPMDQHESTYISWDISFDKIMQLSDSKELLNILNIIAYCNPSHIPKMLIKQYLYESVDSAADIKLNALLGILRKYSLIRVATDTISVHKLVHTWLKSKVCKNRRIDLIHGLIKAINNIYNWNSKQPKDIALARLLLPHAMYLMLEIELDSTDIEYIDLLLVLGNIYNAIDDYDRSKQ
jgi:DNA-binding CsgD family transcriptional regulator